MQTKVSFDKISTNPKTNAMKKLTRIRNYSAVAVLAAILAAPLFGEGQAKMQSNPPVKISVLGTSNIHPWEMKSESGSCSANFTLGADNTLSAVSGLAFSMVVETLKSEHKAMDKNTYKAMDTEKNPNVSFSSAQVAVKSGGAGNYTLTAHGKLTINGVAKDADVVAACAVKADKSISCNGSYKMKMTQFSVKPPSIMFGAIVVGDEVTIKYNLNFK